MPDHACVSCGYPVDFRDPNPVHPVPKGYIHGLCLQRDGRSLFDIGDSMPCCRSREALAMFTQSLVEARDTLPPGQIYVFDRDNNLFHRFQYHPTGPTLFTRLPDLVVSANVKDTEEIA